MSFGDDGGIGIGVGSAGSVHSEEEGRELLGFTRGADYDDMGADTDPVEKQPHFRALKAKLGELQTWLNETLTRDALRGMQERPRVQSIQGSLQHGVESVKSAGKKGTRLTTDQLAKQSTPPQIPSITENVLPSRGTFLFWVGALYLVVSTINYGVIKHKRLDAYKSEQPAREPDECERLAKQDAFLGCTDLVSWYNILFLTVIIGYGMTKQTGDAMYRTAGTVRKGYWTVGSWLARASKAKRSTTQPYDPEQAIPQQQQEQYQELGDHGDREVNINVELLADNVAAIRQLIATLEEAHQRAPAGDQQAILDRIQTLSDAVLPQLQAIQTAQGAGAAVPEISLQPVTDAITALQTGMPATIRAAVAQLATQAQIQQLAEQLTRIENAVNALPQNIQAGVAARDNLPPPPPPPGDAIPPINQLETVLTRIGELQQALTPKANEETLQQGMRDIKAAIGELRAEIAAQPETINRATTAVVEEQIAKIDDAVKALSTKVDDNSKLGQPAGPGRFGSSIFSSSTTTTTRPARFVEDLDIGETAITLSEDQIDARAQKIVKEMLAQVQQAVFGKIPEAQRAQLGFDDEGACNPDLARALQSAQADFEKNFKPTIREALLADVADDSDEMGSYEGDAVRSNAQAIQTSIDEAMQVFTISLQGHLLSQASQAADPNERFQPIVNAYKSAMNNLKSTLTELKNKQTRPVPVGLWGQTGTGKRVDRFGTVSAVVLDASRNEPVAGGPALQLQQCLEWAEAMGDSSTKEGAKQRVTERLPLVIDDLHQEINRLSDPDLSDSDNEEEESSGEKHAKKCQRFLNQIVDCYPSEFDLTDEQQIKIKGIRNFVTMTLVADSVDKRRPTSRR